MAMQVPLPMDRTLAAWPGAPFCCLARVMNSVITGVNTSVKGSAFKAAMAFLKWRWTSSCACLGGRYSRWFQ